MGNAPAVSINPTLGSNIPGLPYLNHALLTFRPIGATFATNFAASTQSWMFRSPDTLQGLVAELTPDTWQSRLKSLGATSAEPVWTAVDAHFNQLEQPDARGFRNRISLPDVVYIGRRTSAVVSANTVTFDTNTAGTVNVKVNPARFLYSASTPAGSLAEVTITADGVKTVADLADELETALMALPAFTAQFAAVSDGVDTVAVTSLVAGYPLIMFVRSSTPGPTMSQAVTTANVADAYYDDLTEMQGAAEFGELVDPPRRRFYWITDLQADDVVNAEGMAWVEDQGDSAQFTPIRDYQFEAWSASGARRITIGGDFVGNFDATSTASAAADAAAANAGEGWTRAGVDDHDRYEFFTAALLGRCIGSLPGLVSFTSKVLYGATDASRMSPRDFGDDETLTFDRLFNWYSAEGPALQGSAKWGYRANGKYADQKWTEDYVRWQVTRDLLEWMQLKNIVTYTDADIKGGEAVIKAAMAKIPAVIPASIGVVSLSRDQVNPANIVARVYYDYVGGGTAAGVINRIGTPSSPIPIVISAA